jgi:hypothetical protein
MDGVRSDVDDRYPSHNIAVFYQILTNDTALD